MRKGRGGGAIKCAAGAKYLYEDGWERLSSMGRLPVQPQIRDTTPTWSPQLGIGAGSLVVVWLHSLWGPTETLSQHSLLSKAAGACTSMCSLYISGIKLLTHAWALTTGQASWLPARTLWTAQWRSPQKQTTLFWVFASLGKGIATKASRDKGLRKD